MQYPGGKVRLSKYIAPILQKYRERRTYLEPFCGMCGMLQAVRGGERIASDVNESLILMLKGLQDGSFYPPACVTKEVYEKLKRERELQRCKVTLGLRFHTWADGLLATMPLSLRKRNLTIHQIRTVG